MIYCCSMFFSSAHQKRAYVSGERLSPWRKKAGCVSKYDTQPPYLLKRLYIFSSFNTVMRKRCSLMHCPYTGGLQIMRSHLCTEYRLDSVQMNRKQLYSTFNHRSANCTKILLLYRNITTTTTTTTSTTTTTNNNNNHT